MDRTDPDPANAPNPNPATVNLSGRWVGHYKQSQIKSGLSAEWIQAEDGSLLGTMIDMQTRRDVSLSEMAQEMGIRPGSDEQILAMIRQSIGNPNLPASEVGGYYELPESSTIVGHVTDRHIEFVKTYQGVHKMGFRIGSRVFVREMPDHQVQYFGQVDPTGSRIHGRWVLKTCDDPSETLTGEFQLEREII